MTRGASTVVDRDPKYQVSTNIDVDPENKPNIIKLFSSVPTERREMDPDDRIPAISSQCVHYIQLLWCKYYCCCTLSTTDTPYYEVTTLYARLAL